MKRDECICFRLVLFFFLELSASFAGVWNVPGKADPLEMFIQAVVEQASYTKTYDPSYVKLAYPNGDVPQHTGVCSDVIIRGLRKIGFDLQKEIHEDMKKHFSVYPKTWGLKKTDSNIDHRRVLNLMCFFTRKKWGLPISEKPSDFLPGDIVAWRLTNGLPHIGVVSSSQEVLSGNYLMVHNIGLGVQIEDVLFGWKIIGHFRLPSSFLRH